LAARNWWSSCPAGLRACRIEHIERARPDASLDGGDLDCGNGLLLLIRRHIDPLDRGQLLEILSTDTSVKQDLPAWCRLTGNELVSTLEVGRQRSFLVCKGSLAERRARTTAANVTAPVAQVFVPVTIPGRLPEPAAAPRILPFAVMGIGSWPRPRWMLRAVHDRMEGRLSKGEFQHRRRRGTFRGGSATASWRRCLHRRRAAPRQLCELRRWRLDNCRLIPLTDLTWS